MRCLLAILLLLALPARAAELVLEGPLEQGGLLYGTTLPGSQVTLDGQVLRVSPEGRFLVGFDRDAAPSAELVVTTPDGTRDVEVLAIAPRTYDIQRIDGLPQDKVTPPEEVWERIKLERELILRIRGADSETTAYLSGFQWPAVGRLTGKYGSQRILNGEARQPHYGLDIAAPTGTPVKAPADGVVLLAHSDLYFSGMTLVIDHGQGLKSNLLHLSALLVKEGDQVAKGQVVAEVGATGRVTGAHLDWRVNWYDRWIDPAGLVGPMPKQ